MKQPTTPRARGIHTQRATHTARGAPHPTQKNAFRTRAAGARRRRRPTALRASRLGDAGKLAASVAGRGGRAVSRCAVAPCRPPARAAGIRRRRAAAGISPTRGPRARNATAFSCIPFVSVCFGGICVGVWV
jgi:hypothetical protein